MQDYIEGAEHEIQRLRELIEKTTAERDNTKESINTLEKERIRLNDKLNQMEKELKELKKVYFDYLVEEIKINEDDKIRFFEYCNGIAPHLWKKFLIENK